MFTESWLSVRWPVGVRELGTCSRRESVELNINYVFSFNSFINSNVIALKEVTDSVKRNERILKGR